jgi:hypothetical protein
LAIADFETADCGLGMTIVDWAASAQVVNPQSQSSIRNQENRQSSVGNPQPT